ncbi:general odorant-binding protein 66-like [Toxorhynchites rutilus septentrionalis]|uniref:general odorant-binding protein 66-like n=1 Tax=Toxorhynchites rutilus septentrionalis TaxID=329112 RepID=UPI002479EF3A|nr:general odorant-binding protein 66-like [Toxorhynchites rutilus septentrionalis]
MMVLIVPMFLFLIGAFHCATALNDTIPASCFNKKFTIDPFFCCQPPKLISEPLVKQCLQLFPVPKSERDELKPDCMSECVMNRTGIFNPQKNINGEKAMDAFTDNLVDRSLWIGIVEKTVKDCLSQAAARKSDFEKDRVNLQAQYKTDRICSPAAAFIMECVHVSVYKSCPANIFKSNQTECVAIRNHLAQCPFYTAFPQPT